MAKINHIDKQITMDDKDMIVSMYDSVASQNGYVDHPRDYLQLPIEIQDQDGEVQSKVAFMNIDHDGNEREMNYSLSYRMVNL